MCMHHWFHYPYIYGAVFHKYLSSSFSILTYIGWCMNIVGLYSGFGWLTSARILGMGARFGIYEVLTAFYKGTLFSLYSFVFLKCFYNSARQDVAFWSVRTDK